MSVCRELFSKTKTNVLFEVLEGSVDVIFLISHNNTQFWIFETMSAHKNALEICYCLVLKLVVDNVLNKSTILVFGIAEYTCQHLVMKINIRNDSV